MPSIERSSHRVSGHNSLTWSGQPHKGLRIHVFDMQTKVRKAYSPTVRLCEIGTE